MDETPSDVTLSNRPWRTGRKVGRTIYAQLNDIPSDTDPLIGVMDTRVLASEAVREHNKRFQIQEAWPSRG